MHPSRFSANVLTRRIAARPVHDIRNIRFYKISFQKGAFEAVLLNIIMLTTKLFVDFSELVEDMTERVFKLGTIT
jgi:hypothetical protein